MLPAPGFHHLHLNSVDPDAAIDFYVRRIPTKLLALRCLAILFCCRP